MRNAGEQAVPCPLGTICSHEPCEAKRPKLSHLPFACEILLYETRVHCLQITMQRACWAAQRLSVTLLLEVNPVLVNYGIRFSGHLTPLTARRVR